MERMPQDEERRLIRRYQKGDSQAAGLLIAQHERALRYMASQVISRCESEEDLFQQACVIFLQSLKKYRMRNKARVRVTTWCYFYVKQQLQRYGVKTGVIRIPSLGFSTDREACIRAMKTMQRGFFEQQPELARNYDDLDAIDDRDERQLFNRALKKLDQRQREIIEWRMLGWKLKDIGEMMGITKERVRQIRDDGLARLRLRCNREPVLIK